MKKLCVLCTTPKAIHFFRPNEWAKEKQNRCSECQRVKVRTGGGAEKWRKSMRKFLTPSTSRPGNQLFVSKGMSVAKVHKSF